MSALRRLAPSPPAPSFYDDLVVAIGATAAAALVDALGGKQLYVPARPGPDHPISRAVGDAAAARLAEFYHSTTITLPITPAKRAQIIALAAAGVRPNDIPRSARVSRSFVYKVLAAERERADDAYDLFAAG